MKVAVIASLLLALSVAPAAAQPIESFDSFIANFEAKALAAGITRETYQAAMVGLTPDPGTPELVSAQPEFTTTMWDYIDLRASPRRITNGKAAMERNAPLFATIGERYGVEPHLLGAIWGIETNYGSVLGDTSIIRPIVRSLATLVHQRRSRLEGDEADLIGALQLVQRGPLDAQHLVGSWAGAIGHLQVNPSNVVKYGTDGDGDGAVDLQDSLADALATSAVFLLGLGYQPGVPCALEVSVPDGFDYLLADRTQMRPVSFFAQKGIARVRGEAFADPNLPVFLYVPAGKDGPKFLMTQNYMVLKGYNLSDSYAMTVAHLADRLNGASAFADDWPRETQFPNIAERKAIQEALIKLGFLSGDVDGRIGPISQAAYARFQSSRGEVADGFITKASYEELAAATR
ncbi:MAG: lytic murein transglycosylase [Devosia sp.]|uniref:lytic murein transglycosylase n=1 Tax=Devosia sp. TaxID=1871048 RepID=UPI00261F6187|nr:lytic murein transglycosylase [Devosia sp.]MDB5527236.1 lytic murein transglycosylase [Devosia sp.]